MNRIASTTLLAALALAAGAAHAQSAGSLIGRIGVTNISPSVSSGNLTPPSFVGTQVDVASATSLGGGITYMVTNNWAIDVPLALPFKHKVSGAGAIAGVGELGHTKALPFTVLAQYRFMEPTAKFRPYVGAGITYAYNFSERTTNTLSALTGSTPPNRTVMDVESKFAPTIAVGASIALSERMYLDLMLGKTFLKNRTTLSTGQTIDVRLNPTTFAVAVGYRF